MYKLQFCTFISVNGVKSELTAVTCGVPQGSALGPLLFLVYVNDIKMAVLGEQIKLFADDTNLFISGCTFGDVNLSANKTQPVVWLADS